MLVMAVMVSTALVVYLPEAIGGTTTARRTATHRRDRPECPKQRWSAGAFQVVFIFSRCFVLLLIYIYIYIYTYLARGARYDVRARTTPA